MNNELVLITGATGFLGMHTIQQLLADGYHVRATVRSLKNEDKLKLLWSIEGANGRLELVEMGDLDKIDIDSVKPLLEGVGIVLHLASPYVITVNDPQRDLVDPAVNGTVSVLAAAHEVASVKKVVLTSSVAAIGDHFENGRVYTENDWNQTSSLKRMPYYYSKTLAEKAA